MECDKATEKPELYIFYIDYNLKKEFFAQLKSRYYINKFHETFKICYSAKISSFNPLATQFVIFYALGKGHFHFGLFWAVKGLIYTYTII